MTQPQLNINTIEEVMEMLQSGGFGSYPEVFRIMLNEAMLTSILPPSNAA